MLIFYDMPSNGWSEIQSEALHFVLRGQITLLMVQILQYMSIIMKHLEARGFGDSWGSGPFNLILVIQHCCLQKITINIIFFKF